MATDYTDNRLFSAASAIYDSELAMCRHYETLRATLTATNVGIVGGVFALASNTDAKTGVALILFIFAIVAGLLVTRLSHAHWFHFHLAAKMRGILAKHHPKTEEKLRAVRKSWGEATNSWEWLRHAFLWIGMNVVPATAASIWLTGWLSE